MMAEIGGYVGLLLGVSIFHFTTWVSEMAEKKIKALEKQETENEAKVRQLDMATYGLGSNKVAESGEKYLQ